MALKHFVLTYETVPDMIDRRQPYRAEHIEMLKKCEAEGKMELAGAFVGDPAGSMLIFKGETDEVARQFAEADPYVTNGLVLKWRIREWTTVVGQNATKSV